MDKNLMKKYAEFIVKVGVNVGPGQTLIIQSPVEAAFFARACAEAAFSAGAADVVVADGFTGNVVLKLTEGVAKSLLGMLKDVFMQSVVTKLCYLGVKGGLRTIKHKMDSEEVGGAPLLGTARPVIKAHGSSKAKGIKNAIRQARLCVEGDLCGTMEAALAELQTDETRAEKSE